MMEILEKLKSLIKDIRKIEDSNEETRLLMGSMLAKGIDSVRKINDAEFKVFSQFGDDGIIQYLIKKINISSNKFVEFGVENYTESNTRFLLMNNNWQGLIIDGSQANIDQIKSKPKFWQYDLTAVSSFITVDNINQILKDNGFEGKIGLLSIDIDGNDYWVWQAITVVDADIVIAEYNSLLGAERSIAVPYKSDFVRSNAHYSNLYFGASLPAFCELAKAKGYTFVCCNQGGNNSYFVKNELLGLLEPQSIKEGYRVARFREARNPQGELTFAKEDMRKEEIKGMPVINVLTGVTETI